MFTSSYTCKYCNLTNIVNINGHKASCIKFETFKENFLIENGSELLLKYQNGISISDLEKQYEVNRRLVERCIIHFGGTLRGLLQDFNSRQILNNKRKNTLQQNYGVTNAGQLENSPIKIANKIPYTTPEFKRDYNDYRRNAERLTKRYLKQCKTQNLLPTHCEYTGFKFADTERNPINPNDWFKRSLDHRLSIWHCYLYDQPVEQACSPSNLVFCLKYINTVKGNIPEEYFVKEDLPKIKHLLTHEN